MATTAAAAAAGDSAAVDGADAITHVHDVKRSLSEEGVGVRKMPATLRHNRSLTWSARTKRT